MPTLTPGSGTAPTTTLAKLVDQTGFLPSWGNLATDDLEKNNLLKFPQSVQSFTNMYRTDAQLQGLMAGSTWPIYRMRWFINPGKAKAERVEKISKDYGLPIADDDMPLRKTKNRFKFLGHLEEALEACAIGFQVFEQNLRYDDPATGGDGLLHLRKLLSIPVTSIQEFNIADDGGIVYIKQGGLEAPPLPIDRLVWYPFQKRGANWTGRSLLRGCYGPWLLKDRAMRIGVMNIQRAGVGTPVIEAHPGASDSEILILNRLAERFKAGERSGGAIPSGAKLKLVGVEGSQPDSVGFIKLMNEEMARAFLEMFIQSGQTGHGSRSQAESLIDYHKLTLEYIANWFAMIFNEHMLEDDWEWNYGEDEEDICRIEWEWDESGAQDEEAAQAAEDPQAELVKKVEEGTVQVDDQVAAALGAVPNSRRPAGRRRGGGKATRAARNPDAAMPPLPLPSRALRRQLYDHEIAAAVDYNALDTTYQSALDLVVQEVRILRGYQIDELHDAIVEAGGDLSTLGELTATLQHSDVVASRLRQVAGLAAEQMVQEARRQGQTLERPDIETLTAAFVSRAEAVDNIITRDISTAASRDSVRLSGGSLTEAEVADQVRTDLHNLSDRYLRDILGGAIQGAINDGRGLVIQKADPTDIYSSEILDTNTCVNCVGRDGTHYQTWEDASKDYPSGGFKDCLGREKCRGLLVAVWNETQPTFLAPFGGAI